ncbi:hypothetical protein G6O69_04715 [Pseudenhygromyxa sp. WMMC2535]|uniref:hypothetical protein n=1 Tax=Pseudenhygromyxa sp. WMMC2535 TaxID=2712867 RepID=UPI0015561AA7|nr:hypothetical protein [Pseudenhygromyxa sp. WMMC2535]NVB37121.1 hypothetical protein [Pseudenhygromyxa sp. WMMC2535]
MPSTLHQGIARILIDEPPLAFRILRELFGLDLPALRDLRARHSVIDRFAPCFGDTHELRPDGVLCGDHPTDPHGGVGIVIEAQRRPDRQKAARLWVYWALVAEELGYVTALLVIALSDQVSAWARGLGKRQLPPRDALLVVDRQNMPVVTTVDDPQRPGWAMLSGIIHAAHGNLEPFTVALKAVLRLEDQRRWRYASYMLSALDEDDRELILGAMNMQTHEISDIERRSVAFHDGRAEGLDEGLAKGLDEGRAKGLDEGLAKGLQQLVLTILELRGLALSDAQRERVIACSELTQLERWRDRAKLANDATDVFTAETLEAP